MIRQSFLHDSLWIRNWASNYNDQVFLVILGLLQWFPTPISTKTFESCFVCDGFDLSWNWTIGEAEGRDRRRVCSRDYRFSLTLPYGNWMMKFVGNEDYIVRLKGWNNRKFHSKILSSFGNFVWLRVEWVRGNAFVLLNFKFWYAS